MSEFSFLLDNLKLDTLNSKDRLLAIDKERLKLESKIFEITDYLNQDGFPGVEKPLIDEEGFPLPGLDLYAIREARHNLIKLQNDHKFLMTCLEKEMHQYFDNEKKENKIEYKQETKEYKDPQLIQVFEDNSDFNSYKSSLKTPFCVVENVLKCSPAEIAGFVNNDLIYNFGGIDINFQNPLEKIGLLVKNSEDKEIIVEVYREKINEHLKLKLVPKKWEGNGLLGFKINLIKN